MNMLYIRSAVLVSVSSAALSPLPSARAWGCTAHQTVALIAEKHLTSEARQLVQKLLTENPIDPELKRYCGTSGRDLLTDSSTWRDDVRNEVRTGPGTTSTVREVRPAIGSTNSAAQAVVLQKPSPINWPS